MSTKIIKELKASIEMILDKDKNIYEDRLKSISVILALYKYKFTKDDTVKTLTESSESREYFATVRSIYDFLNADIEKIDYKKVEFLRDKIFEDNIDYLNDPIIYYKEEKETFIHNIVQKSKEV